MGGKGERIVQGGGGWTTPHRARGILQERGWVGRWPQKGTCGILQKRGWGGEVATPHSGILKERGWGGEVDHTPQWYPKGEGHASHSTVSETSS